MDINKKIKLVRSHPFVVVLCSWYVLAWSWTFLTDSLDLAGSKIVAMVIAFFVVLLNVLISVNLVVRAFRFLRVKLKDANIWIIFAICLPIFALMDFLVSWLTAIIWLGPQGSVDNVLPLSSPTLILINTPLRYASRFVGFYGLAAFFWLIVFLTIHKKYRRHLKFAVVLVVALSILGWIFYGKTSGREIKASIISESLTEQVGDMANRGSSLVVFPEYGLDESSGASYKTRLSKNNDGTKTYFLGSKQVFDNRPAGHLNVLMFGNNEGGLLNEQNKYRLIPGGEDLGYVVRTGLRATNQRATLDYFSYAKMVNKGTAPLHPEKIDDNTIIGSAVCSSIISPEDYRTFASQGATLFSNSASLTIFKGSRVFAWQQKSLAKFMATANSRYFLQSANAATAYMLDNNGKQLTEIRGIKAIDVNAKNNLTKTPYTYFGEWLAWIGIFIVFIWLASLLIRHKVKKPKSKKKSLK